MAKIVFGAGLSHTPILALDPRDWAVRAKADCESSALNLSDGRWLSYAELEREVGAVYKDVATFDVFKTKSLGSQIALDRVAKDLNDADPDAVIIIGDDQRELFSSANQPTIAIYHGDRVTTLDQYSSEDHPAWIKTVGRAYAMDTSRSFPGAPSFALELIGGLIERGVDVSSLSEIVDPKTAGFGHAFGFVIKRLFEGRAIPIIPVLLNTYYPPNVPTAARCLAIGEMMRAAIEDVKSDLRVAIIASGGLSHFVVDEDLDQKVFEGLNGNHDLLRALPRGALNSGSSEILNWILVAGAMAKRPLKWKDYYPIYRTPAGTGVGVGFAVWDIPEGYR